MTPADIYGQRDTSPWPPSGGALFNRSAISSLNSHLVRGKKKKEKKKAGAQTCTFLLLCLRDKRFERLGSDQLIYSVNRSRSAQVWDSKAKSSVNISTYWELCFPTFLPPFGSDGPYMGWLSDRLKSGMCSTPLLIGIVSSSMPNAGKPFQRGCWSHDTYSKRIGCRCFLQTPVTRWPLAVKPTKQG